MDKTVKNPQLEALQKIKDFVGADGLVSFEHSYRRPVFTVNGYKYRCSMVSDKVAYCRKYYEDKSFRNCNLLLSVLPTRTLKKLHDELNRYLEYCQKEA